MLARTSCAHHLTTRVITKQLQKSVRWVDLSEVSYPLRVNVDLCTSHTRSSCILQAHTPSTKWCLRARSKGVCETHFTWLTHLNLSHSRRAPGRARGHGRRGVGVATVWMRRKCPSGGRRERLSCRRHRRRRVADSLHQRCWRHRCNDNACRT